MDVLNWVSKIPDGGTALFILLVLLMECITRILVSWARAFAVAKEAKYGVVRIESHPREDDEDDEDDEDEPEVLEQTSFHRAINAAMTYMLQHYPGKQFWAHMPDTHMVESHLIDIEILGEDQTTIRLVVNEGEDGEFEVQAQTKKVA